MSLPDVFHTVVFQARTRGEIDMSLLHLNSDMDVTAGPHAWLDQERDVIMQKRQIPDASVSTLDFCFAFKAYHSGCSIGI